MARFSMLVPFVVAVACVSNAIAGPVGGSGQSCVARYRGQPDCLSKCKRNWGLGSVVLPSGVATQLEAYIAQACGSSVPSGPTATRTPTPVPSLEPPTSAAPTQSSSSSVSSSADPAPTSSSVLSSASSSSLPVSSAPATSSSSSVPNVVPTTVPTSSSTTVSSTSPPSTSSSSSRAVPSSTTSTTPAAQPTTTVSGDRQAWLDGHNTVRARHGANPLVWGDDLEAAAQKWANNCVWKHSGGAVGKFGENLAAGSGSYSATSAVQAWASEVSQYDPNNPTYSHFTQVVWKSTTRLGCATASCPSTMIPGWSSSMGNIRFHVCEYDPPGNFNGQYAQNVQV